MAMQLIRKKLPRAGALAFANLVVAASIVAGVSGCSRPAAMRRARGNICTLQFAKQYPSLNLATIADVGGWATAQQKFFADGGVFDQIYAHGQ
jgi:ABC-type sulfate transport system substrate-binding protein